MKIFCQQVSGVSLDGSEEDRRIFFREKNAVGHLSVSLPPPTGLRPTAGPVRGGPWATPDALAYFCLGSAPEEQRKLPPAADAYRKTLALSPGFQQAQLRLRAIAGSRQ